jgi:hypothetical protein
MAIPFASSADEGISPTMPDRGIMIHGVWKPIKVGWRTMPKPVEFGRWSIIAYEGPHKGRWKAVGCR